MSMKILIVGEYHPDLIHHISNIPSIDIHEKMLVIDVYNEIPPEQQIELYMKHRESVEIEIFKPFSFTDLLGFILDLRRTKGFYNFIFVTDLPLLKIVNLQNDFEIYDPLIFLALLIELVEEQKECNLIVNINKTLDDLSKKFFMFFLSQNFNIIYEKVREPDTVNFKVVKI